MRKVHLTSAEYSALIRAAVDGQIVIATFGPGWVALQDVPENDWAFERLAEMREPKQEADS